MIWPAGMRLQMSLVTITTSATFSSFGAPRMTMPDPSLLFEFIGDVPEAGAVCFGQRGGQHLNALYLLYAVQHGADAGPSGLSFQIHNLMLKIPDLRLQFFNRMPGMSWRDTLFCVWTESRICSSLRKRSREAGPGDRLDPANSGRDTGFARQS